MLNEALSKVTITESPGLVRAIIVPHAGYRHCVETSMHAFAQIDPSLYDRVIVLGPSHRVPIPCCTIADADRAESPYGDIPFDMTMIATLLGSHPGLFSKLDIDTAEIEHSLEMEFPLLKFIFRQKPFTLVPIMIGRISAAKSAEIAAALAPFVDPRTLLVISSDFCHWGDRFHFTFLPDVPGAVYEKIEALDRSATEKISSGSPEAFEQYLEETGNTICGRRAILIMMRTLQNWTASWPAYSHSSDITSKRDSCVSYMAGVIRTQ
jgi:AmmeMemoRadiSam system protein B